MTEYDSQLKGIWRQTQTPVLFRRGMGYPLLLKLPYAPDNRGWIRNGQRSKPIWCDQYKCWEVPQAWFEKTIRAAFSRFRRIYVIQPVRKQQHCAPACWDAQGIECECSCMGENHGTGHPNGRWYVVSETCAVSWGEREYVAKLMEPN